MSLTQNNSFSPYFLFRLLYRRAWQVPKKEVGYSKRGSFQTGVP